jgi:hypothetical protein
VIVRERPLDLVDERAVRNVQVLGEALAEVPEGERARAVKAHEEHVLEVLERVDHRALVGERGARQVVDLALACVAREHSVNRSFELTGAFRLGPHPYMLAHELR